MRFAVIISLFNCQSPVFMQPAGIETLSKGTKYTLVIDSIYGLQKAEQPLKIKGHWECEFTVGE